MNSNKFERYSDVKKDFNVKIHFNFSFPIGIISLARKKVLNKLYIKKCNFILL